MPYINAEQTKEVREAIKKAFPEYRFSVRKEDKMSLNITVKSGPVDFKLEEGYCQLNEHWYETHYEGNEEVIKFAKKLFEVINNVHPQREVVYDSDYGSVPNYYRRFSIGSWDKAYEQKLPKTKKKKIAKPSYAECFEYAFGL